MSVFLSNISQSYCSKYKEQICTSSSSPRNLAWLLSLAVATFLIFAYHHISYARARKSMERERLREVRRTIFEREPCAQILAYPKEEREMRRAYYILDMNRVNLNVDEGVYLKYKKCYLSGWARKGEFEELEGQVFLPDAELSKVQRMGEVEFSDYWHSLGEEERRELRKGIAGGVFDGWTLVD